jgi:hypothetical protein
MSNQLPRKNRCGRGLLLDRAHRLSGQELKEAVVDSSYAGQVDLRVAQQREVVVYAPTAGVAAPLEVVDRRGIASQVPGVAAPAMGRRPPAVLPKESFVGVEADPTYECPSGHRLVFERRGRERRQGGEEVGYRQYRCPPRYCRECPLVARCTKAPDRGRTIKRSDEEELVAALRQRMSQPAGQQRYRLRKQTVELGYADLKAHRGLMRFHSFGLERATAQIGLLVLMHNGKTVVKALNKPRRGDATPIQDAA